MFSEINACSILLIGLILILAITAMYYRKKCKRFSKWITSGMKTFKRKGSDTGVNRVTGNYELDKTIETAGYSYDVEQDIFYSSMDAWQRNMGIAVCTMKRQHL